MKVRRKGPGLERAIEFLERTILNEVPSLSDKSYDIYTNRIIIVDGVKHEIDIWVEFDIGSGYKSIFIFETKNWKKKIGKNDMIIFSEKISAATAQKGFFVAKAFTKYAIAAAKRDHRIQVLPLETEFLDNESMDTLIRTFHRVILDRANVNTQVRFVTQTGTQNEPGKQIEIQTATLNGYPINVSEYIGPRIQQIVIDHVNSLPTADLPDGVYTYDLSEEILLASDHLVINDIERYKVQLQITYQIEVIPPPIVSKYDVAKRGRIYTYAPVRVGEQRWSQTVIVETGAD